MLTQICKTCKLEKPITNYAVAPTNACGRRLDCNICYNLRQFHKRQQNVAFQIWSQAKKRSAKLGRMFNILPEDVVVPTHCPLLGIELQMGVGVHQPNSPSLDRIDSDKGYTKDNIWVISRRANVIKSNATIFELELIVKNWELYESMQLL